MTAISMRAITMGGLVEEVHRLRDENAYLKGLIAAQGIEIEEEVPTWADGLAPGEIATMCVLIKAKGRIVNTFMIEEAIPKRDHTLDRDMRIVDVYISNIRKKLGKDAIITVWGRGYRVSQEFLDTLKQNG